MAGVARRRRLVAATLAAAVLLLAAGNAIEVAAQISAPTAPPACPNFILAMAPCLGYVTGLSNDSNPICCAAFAVVARTSPACLCQFFSVPSPLGIPMNLTRVRNLPRECNISVSSLPQCTGADVPYKPPTTGLPVTPPNAVPGSIPAPPATPPAGFFPVTPTTGSPIPAPGTNSAPSMPPIFPRLPHPSGNNTSGAGALSRPSAMGVCLGVFLATTYFM